MKKIISTDNLSSDFTLDIKGKRIQISDVLKNKINSNRPTGDSITNNQIVYTTGITNERFFSKKDRFVVLDSKNRLTAISNSSYDISESSSPTSENGVFSTSFEYIGNRINEKSREITSEMDFVLQVEDYSSTHSVIVELRSNARLTLPEKENHGSISYSEEDKRLIITYKFPDGVDFLTDGKHKVRINTTSALPAHIKVHAKRVALPEDGRARSSRYSEVENANQHTHTDDIFTFVKIPVNYIGSKDASIEDPVNLKPGPEFNFNFNFKEELHGSDVLKQGFTSSTGMIYPSASLNVENKKIIRPFKIRKVGEHSDFVNLIETPSLKDFSVTIPNVRNIMVMAAPLFSGKLGNNYTGFFKIIEENQKFVKFSTFVLDGDIDKYDPCSINGTGTKYNCTFENDKLTFKSGAGSAIIYVTFDTGEYAGKTVCFKLATLHRTAHYINNLRKSGPTITGLNNSLYRYEAPEGYYVSNENIGSKPNYPLDWLLTIDDVNIGTNLDGKIFIIDPNDRFLEATDGLENLHLDRFTTTTDLYRKEKAIVTLEAGKAYNFKIEDYKDLPFMFGNITIASDGRVTVKETATERDSFDYKLLKIEIKNKS